MKETLKNLCLLFAGAIASVIGGILLSPPVPRKWIYISSTVVVILILYGSGAISKTWHVCNLRRRKGNRLFPSKIGILDDIPWNPNEWQNAWSDITPREWKEEIRIQAKQIQLRVKVKLVSIRKNLDSYAAIVNPFGGAYSETDIRNTESLNKIFDYVKSGGLFVT